MRLEPTKEGRIFLDSLLLWTQTKAQYPVEPARWCGLLSTHIFLDLCTDTGPALEVKELSFASLYNTVRTYSKYADDWSEAELYLACRSLPVNRFLRDVYAPVRVTSIVREILGRFYSALASSERLQIVLLLRGAGGLLSVTEIAEQLGRLDKVQSVRRHLRILHEVRIVERHWEDGAGRYQYDRRAIMANLELTQEAVL